MRQAGHATGITVFINVRAAEELTSTIRQNGERSASILRVILRPELSIFEVP